MRKLVLILLLLCFSSAGYAAEYKGEVVDVRSVGATVLSGELYVTDADGKYNGYKKLNGYPGQEVFQVYFQGGNNGKVEFDILNINLEERIDWEYKGIDHNNSRMEIYKMFAEMQCRRSVAVQDTWQYQTFGKVYTDWLKQITYQQDAFRLVSAQQMFARGERPYNRFTTADIKVQ